MFFSDDFRNCKKYTILNQQMHNLNRVFNQHDFLCKLQVHYKSTKGFSKKLDNGNCLLNMGKSQEIRLQQYMQMLCHTQDLTGFPLWHTHYSTYLFAFIPTWHSGADCTKWLCCCRHSLLGGKSVSGWSFLNYHYVLQGTYMSNRAREIKDRRIKSFWTQSYLDVI